MGKFKQAILSSLVFAAACGGVQAGNPKTPDGKLVWIDQRFPSAATSGSAVNLRGVGFGVTTGTVWIDGKPAAMRSWSEDEIFIDAPASVTGICSAVTVQTEAGEVSNYVPLMYGENDLWIPASEAPSARAGHVAVWSGREMIVFGGGFNDGGRYNPDTDSWIRIQAPDMPLLSAYRKSYGFWTGTEMVFFGFTGDQATPRPFVLAYDPKQDSWRRLQAGEDWASAGIPEVDDAAFVRRGVVVAIRKGEVEFKVIVPEADRLSSVPNVAVEHDFDANETRATTRAREPIALKMRLVAAGDRLFVIEYDPGGSRQRVLEFEWDHRHWVVVGDWAPTELPLDKGTVLVWSGSEILLWGYKIGSAYGAAFSPLTGKWRSLSNAPIVAREQQVAFWSGSEMLAISGDGGGAAYNPRTDTWRALPRADAPGARRDAAAVFTGDAILYWGDSVDGVPMQGGRRFDLSSERWSSPFGDKAMVSPNEGQSLVWTGAEVIIFGGRGAAGEQVSSGRYDPVRNAWRPLSEEGQYDPVCHGCRFSTAVWTGKEMFVWRTEDGGAAYDPAVDQWRPVAEPGIRRSIYGHSLVWTGTEAIVWGGAVAAPAPVYITGSTAGARWNPVSGQWTKMAQTQAPGGRALHAAVWTGEEMLVYGGTDTPGPLFGGLVSGGRYDPLDDAWAPMADAPERLRMYEGLAGYWNGKEFIVAGQRNAWGPENYDWQLDPEHRRQNNLLAGAYDPVANAWSVFDLHGAGGAVHPALTSRDDEIFLYSGPEAGDNPAGVRYDRSTGRWRPMNTGCMRSTNSWGEGWAYVQTHAIDIGDRILVWGPHGMATYLP